MKSNSINFCEFCHKLCKAQEFLYEDNKFFAFYDIDRATARQHVLVCPKDHIETALDIHDKEVLFKMQQIGNDVLNRVCESEGLNPVFKFGFHLPPYNSIDHVHLHCFVLPFTSLVKDKIVYGKMLTSVQELGDKLRGEAYPRF